MGTIGKQYRPAGLCKPDFWSKIGMPARGAKLHEALHEGVSYQVYVNLAAEARLEQKKLAVYVTIPPATLQRRARAGRFTTVESDRLYRFAEVLKAATDLFEGDQDRASKWMSSPVRGLGGRRPVDMFGTSTEAEAVLELIGRLEHGVIV